MNVQTIEHSVLVLAKYECILLSPGEVLLDYTRVQFRDISFYFIASCLESKIK